MIGVCKTILSKVLDKCYFLQKIVEAFTTPTNIIESELFTKLTSQANWTEVVDKTIKQPANANDGEQYVVLLRKVENGNTTYDAQFLTSSKQTKQEVVEKVVSTTKNTELPVTYDNPILFVVLAITVALLVIIGIKIAKARKNENQK